MRFRVVRLALRSRRRPVGGDTKCSTVLVAADRARNMNNVRSGVSQACSSLRAERRDSGTQRPTSVKVHVWVKLASQYEQEAGFPPGEASDC